MPGMYFLGFSRYSNCWCLMLAFLLVDTASRERQVKPYQSAFIPGDALSLVGVGVGVAVNGASLAAEEAVERGTDLVATTRLDGVALSATSLEEVGTLLGVTYRSTC